MPQDVAILMAKDAIRELTAAYCRAVMRADGSGFAELFVENGRLAIAGGDALVGRHALASYIGSLRPLETLPLIHNHIIAIAADGGSATGSCVVFSPVGIPELGGFVADYEDSYRHEGGRWRLVTRQITMLHAERGNSEPAVLSSDPPA